MNAEPLVHQSRRTRMKLIVCRTFALVAACVLALSAAPALAQGVTTGGISGIVTDAQQLAVPGASVIAIHEPVRHDLRSDDARGRPLLHSGHARRRAVHGHAWR